MKYYKISEVIYLIISIISAFKTVQIWNIDTQKAYLFLGFSIISLFMFLFRRRYRKKFNEKMRKK